ncbi:zinc ribbon domain-containing protein [Companilactobacillus sp.]|jgi:hypothetical protein|uniref:zinc ribbon domain-containing protein n=1 Tax=Companilactobacillus sp. TaxID=2767905 RepID=UPI0025C5B520|nr:zinc-ribbon domain-containing protein [Companilactobacillus sp.]MCH4009019.1 zinc ribbon domain-containing protein [Companilactobacillus sp.]MCH4050802.1 zinc ribbon domain-containing protein [Companilactobacillus sp.]MCH4076961.1 zinc ribbon domain-containing protein [Companilactobacillus sp.]MCH4125537.1 zinc ribbon domain-containing protein [Companilactobacillus sp.]MCI1311246.1 zinc ribbon domain-containing protein [Companilactobacillus sp.]
MKCPNCGADIVAGQKFCNKCGFPIEKYANKTAGNQNPAAQSNPNPAPQQPVNQQPVQNNGVNQQPQQNYQPVQPTQNMGAQPIMGNVQNNMNRQPVNQNFNGQDNNGNQYSYQAQPQVANNGNGQSFSDVLHKMIPFANANYGTSILAIIILVALWMYAPDPLTIIVLIAMIVGWYFGASKFGDTSINFNNGLEGVFLARNNQNQRKLSDIVKWTSIIAAAVTLIFVFVGTYFTITGIDTIKQLLGLAGGNADFLKSDYTLFGGLTDAKKVVALILGLTSDFSADELQTFHQARTFLNLTLYAALLGPIITVVFSFVKIKFSRLLRVLGGIISSAAFLFIFEMFKMMTDSTDSTFHNVAQYLTLGFSSYITPIAAVISLIAVYAWAIREKRNFQ